LRTRWLAHCAAVTLLGLAWAAATAGQPEPRDAAADLDQPGLALVLRSSHTAATDARIARLPGLYVPEGQTASPFLDTGPFEATFRGAIELDLNDSYRFSVRGAGAVRLSIAGKVVIEQEELPAGEAPLSTDGEVHLRKGLNPIELAYRSPAAGDASLRLTWANDYLPEEPLPPELLRHADSPALELSLARRAARDLVADSMCVRCHPAANAPSAPIDRMPELQATGPDLDGIGSRLRPRWIQRWLLDPKALRPQARMPRTLSTDAAEARQQAADLAEYLVTVGDDGSPTETERATPTGSVPDGRRLYADVGCAACHGDATSTPALHAAPRLVARTEIPGGSDGDDPALRLGDKWQPTALAGYLIEPARFDPWSRMPGTALGAAEADSLALYLLTPVPDGGAAPAEPSPPPPRGTIPDAIQGNAERGRQLADELRCRSCHALPGGEPPPPAAPVNELAGRVTTWIADADTTNHPRYDLVSTQVEAIERFLAADLKSLSRAVPAEFAERQIRSAGCLACHGRDGVPATWSPPSGNTRPSSAEDTAQNDFAAQADEESGPDVLPPDLTWTGEKLRSGWLADFLGGRTADRPRPHLPVRMPAFAAHSEILAAGLHHQHGLPEAPPDNEPVDSQLAAIGRNLIRGDRLGCHSCHALGTDPALGGDGSEETINFDLARRRLRRAWFDRFLRDPQRILPGSKMPQFVDEDGYTALYDVFDGEASRQFEAIWHYLGTLD
jgi:mono/diheme cytochrome c family protein